MLEQKLDRLRKIKTFTKENKDFVIALTKEFFNEDFKAKENCSNCWQDQVTILILKIKNELKKESGELTCKYRLKEGIRDFKWNGIEYSRFTITNENAELLAKFNPTVFKRFIEEIYQMPKEILIQQ